VITQFNWN